MDATESQRLPGKPRWFQYRLRTLLAFVTLCSLACSWFACRMEHANAQQKAVEAIRNIRGCDVAYANDRGGVFEPKWDATETAAQIERALLGYPPPPPPRKSWVETCFGKDFADRAVEVGVPLAKVPDALPHLSRLPYLRRVRILVTQDDPNEHLLAAIESVEQEVPGVEALGLEFDFHIGENVLQSRNGRPPRVATSDDRTAREPYHGDDSPIR